MSRIGKKPISIPPKTEVKMTDGVLTVKGPSGEISRKFESLIKIEPSADQIILSPVKEDPFSNKLWGTYASHISNMIKGVNEPFEKKLIIEGIGFRAELQGQTLVMNLGFSHPIEVQVPQDINVAVQKDTITISGIDKEKVGQFAANVRAFKKPEPYKGKGIRYDNEVVKRKQGKKVA